MTPNFIILFLILSSLSLSQSAVFENITVILTSRWPKLYYNGLPPNGTVYIESSNSLGEFVNNQPSEIVAITKQNVPVLKASSITNLPSITDVYVTFCQLRKIEPGTFSNVPKLDIINLGENQLEEIEDGVFSNLLVKTLDLHRNRLSKLGPAAFNNMSHLTTIYLNDNRLSKWNSNWFLGSPVFNVFLVNNQIEELPADSFGYLFEYKRANVPLTVLNFIATNNTLKKIHEKAFRRVNGFGILSLANNSLEVLPWNVFKTVKNINEIHLGFNKIVNLDGVFDDININFLHLEDNTLTCFPTEVFEVSRIGQVFVSGNPLTCECVDHWEKWQKRNRIMILILTDFDKDCSKN